MLGARARRRCAAAPSASASTTAPPAGRRSLRTSGVKAAQQLIDYATKHYSTTDSKDMKLLRRRLTQAGIYDPHAPQYFFFVRLVRRWWRGGVVLRAADVGHARQNARSGCSSWWPAVLGYLTPSLWLDKRVKAKKAEHQAGFPDLMDLLVVCADAGLAMEASLDRVGRELGEAYPSLAANIHMATLEIRAGRTLSEALDHLGDRLGLDEARSFATLIQQSDELGSSISDALRVYSEDMRHKRMSRAEEKAYSLPAKLSVPMMVCIFPTLFVVILLPVIVRMSTGNWQ